jgi:integrase
MNTIKIIHSVDGYISLCYRILKPKVGQTEFLMSEEQLIRSLRTKDDYRHQELLIDPVYAVLNYIEIRNKKRNFMKEAVNNGIRIVTYDQDLHNLFLTDKHTNLSSDRAANLVLKLLKEAGVDVDIFKGHSVRHAAITSMMEKSEGRLDLVMDAARLKSSNTLFHHYYKPWRNNSRYQVVEKVFGIDENVQA